jgi:hypothetical protein
MKDDAKNNEKEENLSGTPLEFPKVDLCEVGGPAGPPKPGQGNDTSCPSMCSGYVCYG